MDRILYVKDVLEQLNIKSGYLYKLISNDEIKSFKMGKKRAFMQSEVDWYIRDKAGISPPKVIPLSPKEAMAKGLTCFNWSKFTYDDLCSIWSLIGRLEGHHEAG